MFPPCRTCARHGDRRLLSGGCTRKVAAVTKHPRCALIVPLLLLLTATLQSSSIEHPGVLNKDDNCSSCHADKTTGKSVHSAMALSCTVCHLAETQGDMTTLNLVTAKKDICFTCHERSAALRRHSPIVNRLCVDCHDPHSSSRRMLLRVRRNARPGSMTLPFRAREVQNARFPASSRLPFPVTKVAPDER